MSKKKNRGKEMTQSEFAEFIGCSVSTVRKAIKEGRITDASIDRFDSGRLKSFWSLDAKREWASNYSLGNNPDSPVADSFEGLAEMSERPDEKDKDIPEIMVSKKKSEFYKAELAKIELEEKERTVGNIAEINSQLQAFGIEVRVAIEGVGAACVDDVMLAETRGEKEAVILKSCREALRKLTDVVARDFDL